MLSALFHAITDWAYLGAEKAFFVSNLPRAQYIVRNCQDFAFWTAHTYLISTRTNGGAGTGTICQIYPKNQIFDSKYSFVPSN